MNHWKTNLGGAISVTGTSLIAVGVLGNMTSGPHSTLLWYVALVGFIFSATGKGLTALFAADATTVSNISAAVDTINRVGPSYFAPPSANKTTETKP